MKRNNIHLNDCTLNTIIFITVIVMTLLGIFCFYNLNGISNTHCNCNDSLYNDSINNSSSIMYHPINHGINTATGAYKGNAPILPTVY